MAGKVVLIEQGTALSAALTLDRLTTLLKEAKIESVVVKPIPAQIEQEISGADLFVFFTGDFVFNARELMDYLREISIGMGRPFCLVGYEKELSVVREAFPRKAIMHEITRPFDVKGLAVEIGELLKAKSGFSVKEHILLVDDDPTFLRMMQGWLGTSYTVAASCSGMQAIEYLAKHKVDLILLDYDMPVTSGPQVLEMLRNEPLTCHIPVIFLTGRNDRDSVMSVMSLKPEGYILKSMGRAEVLDAVDRFFKSKK